MNPQHDSDNCRHAAVDSRREWGIAELASDFNITPRAIRFYEDKGLLKPQRIGNQRVFSLKDRRRLEIILRAKRTGFTLEDIRHYLDVVDGRVKGRDALTERVKDFKRVIGNLGRKRRDIDLLVKDLKQVCGQMERYLKTAPESPVFEFAADYDALFRKQMDEEDFLPQ